MKKLTEKQQKVLDFIKNYIQQNGYSPSIRDIAKHFKLTPRGAHIHVIALEKKGYITRNPKNSRSISLVKRQESILIPVKGKISAGMGIEMFEIVDEEIEIPVRMISGFGNYFALKVEGNSMIDAHIINGDYVILKKQYRIPNGQIAAVVFDNKVTLKRFYHKKDKVELVPENKDMNPIVCDAKDIKVIGKLVGIIRFYE
ncbi:LexA family transcriptional regulator [Thermosipho melanesiensis]|uniref:LexA repressor n=2 Tax=Thermosipho melanesiensis TaxID=46541 RepID=LEXA_THEM4|nr:transcriptional repressor LexA [Thermosipho melanesiensis]A6LM87.1 RecName: Full=LexA repressor [Thermosipho melanesiensis BI429]ABR31038.1 SOS-response transcriptional repressor, LexA [Thermosipho melanesiensis BI429]APT74132.1 LexA family transcriptional regulator [Thermosipho melanesiensis]OOC36080.1 LexA family transcriptional regulator [Thermosipho melanesiensis]OOC36897.1 LexA family transcriptional regulator [Thermosipho melanesiensis]OOC37648.1 LexA family transcriptional regulator